MGTSYENDVYRPNLEKAAEYEDFICEQLHAQGIVLQNVRSRCFQARGENLLGLEIKFDGRMKETGNVYIETHEKSHPDRPNYVESGIHRKDNSWLYGVGDYEWFFIFGKRFLQRLDALIDIKCPDTANVERRRIATSKGFTIPCEIAEKWAERVLDFCSEPCKAPVDETGMKRKTETG